MPYTVTPGVAGTVNGADGVAALTAAAIANLVVFLVAFRSFVRFVIDNPLARSGHLFCTSCAGCSPATLFGIWTAEPFSRESKRERQCDACTLSSKTQRTTWP